MKPTRKCVEACIPLLQRELAAMETYREAKNQLRGHSDFRVLSEIERDHRDSAALIRTRLRNLGEDPEALLERRERLLPSTFAAASVFGEATAIGALIAEERLSIAEYEAVLENTEVGPEVKADIRGLRLPLLHDHVEALDHLRAIASREIELTVK